MSIEYDISQRTRQKNWCQTVFITSNEKEFSLTKEILLSSSIIVEAPSLSWYVFFFFLSSCNSSDLIRRTRSVLTRKILSKAKRDSDALSFNQVVSFEEDENLRNFISSSYDRLNICFFIFSIPLLHYNVLPGHKSSKERTGRDTKNMLRKLRKREVHVPLLQIFNRH